MITISTELKPCPFCGGQPRTSVGCRQCGARAVIWDSDFMFEDYGYEGDGLIHVCHCTNRGAEIEYRIPLGDDTCE